MNIKAVLFDLDGTLLPLDQDVFIKSYLSLLAKKLAPYGYEPDALVKSIWIGTGEMIKNNGEKTNEKVFWDKFAELHGEKAREDEPLFEEFYRQDFGKIQAVCGYNPEASRAVAKIKEMGLRAALATTPIFPAIATEQRIAWAGLKPSDFEIYTTYENSRHAKPNPAYYMDVANALGVSPKECLMVGNDAEDDMIAETVGMKVFLVPKYIVNKENKDISKYPQGDFSDLIDFIKEQI